MGLAQKSCVPCEGGVLPLGAREVFDYLKQVPGWKSIRNHHIAKVFEFSDFKTALAFVNEVGVLAEKEGHHPDINLSWGKAQIELWTHKIDGLTESDFVLAAKIDTLKR